MHAAARPWWRRREVLHGFLVDLLADELARLRRRREQLTHPWPELLRLDEDLGVDSLELLTLATAVSEALHLHQAGVEDYLLARRRVGDWVDIAQAGLGQYSAALTFRTSGSTSVPKPCVHELEALLQEAAFHASLLPDRQRVLVAVPTHHIYGFLFAALLPDQLGITPDQIVDLRSSLPARLAHAARPGDLVIGHPEYWQAVARSVPKLPPGVVGITSTAPCPDGTSAALAGIGLDRLVQIYGASETAGIGWRESHERPYSLMPWWRFGEGAANLLRTGTEGETRSVQPQDDLERVEDRQFLVRGRRDHAVQVGGVNVFPERVRQVLLQHPLVQDAAVRLMRPDEGTRLKAFVVPKRASTDEDLLAALVRWVDAQLSVPERPKAITFGGELPKSGSSKLADWPV